MDQMDLLGKFYQSCWDIVGPNIVRMVLDLFSGNSLPKFIIYTNLVLLSKKVNVQPLSDIKPISPSNFKNKILSKIIHDRFEGVLPKVISPNQSSFLKGRSIVENVLLTVELIEDISKREISSNIIIKLDMAKA